MATTIAVVRGNDSGSEAEDGTNMGAFVVGDSSFAYPSSDDGVWSHNNVLVMGNGSSAAAEGGIHNTVLVLGNVSGAGTAGDRNLAVV